MISTMYDTMNLACKLQGVLTASPLDVGSISTIGDTLARMDRLIMSQFTGMGSPHVLLQVVLPCGDKLHTSTLR